MTKRDRKRHPARRIAFLNPKPRILILSEGEVSEPEYLEGFVKACRNPRVKIEIVGGAGVPRTIVDQAKFRKKAAEKQAKKEADDFLKFDEVWCVFDVDDHPNLTESRNVALAGGIRLAISNPCFEIWLWLHFAEQPGAQHRDALLNMLKKHLPTYDKHVNFDDFVEAYPSAVIRARKLQEIASLDHDEGRNPTTGFWELTESIRSDS